MAGLELVHPELELLSAPGQPPLSPHLTPIYPATDGLTQTRLRNLIDQLLLRMQQLGAPPDYLAGLTAQQGEPRCRSRSPARSAACSPRSEHDLARDVPMMRLVQGDVGCGKTVVAAAAAARAVGSGRQAALMAPTELLAEQHWRNFDRWFRPLGITVALLRARSRHARGAARSRPSARARCRSAVGTHALFQEAWSVPRPGAGPSSTSSTASACSSAWRCRKKGGAASMCRTSSS
jgi:ATP-dependent DNA helicase RecG